MVKNTETEKKEDLKVQTKKAEKPVKEKMVKIKESERVKIVEEAARYKEQYVRLYAEFENARKRMDREKLDFVKYANEGLIIEFLEILDNLQRSVESAQTKHEDYEAFLKGIEMVMAHIHEMLKKNGVEPIEAKGKMFDPHCHEALMQEETEELEEDMVMEELQKGYRLGDRVVRTAKVKIAKGKQEKIEG